MTVDVFTDYKKISVIFYFNGDCVLCFKDNVIHVNRSVYIYFHYAA